MINNSLHNQKKQTSSGGRLLQVGKFLALLMLLLSFTWTMKAESLTVHDGTGTSSYVPAYGFYADAYLKCEMVYPAAELSDMANGTINSITFYASTPAAEAWTGTWQVFVTEVADATISAFAGPGTFVYEGALDGTQSEMTITFDAPYAYNGGNLLIGVYEIETGNYKSVTWAGETVDGASVQGYSYSGLDAISATQRNFLPKTTFDYEIGGGGGVISEFIDFEDGAIPEGWTSEGNSSWVVATGDYSSSTGAHSGTYNIKCTHTTSGSSTYFVSPAMDLSNAVSGTVNCWFVNRSWAGDIDGFGLYYRVNGGDWNELYYTSTAHSTWSEMGEINLEGFGANYQIGFKMYDSYGYGVGIDDIDINIVLGGGGGEPFEVQVGDGTIESGYYPFYTLYNYSIAEGLYRASELYEAGMSAGTINSLSWYALNETGNEQQGITIWMANVTDDELTTTSHVVTGMTKVFTGTSTPVIGWNEFEFNESSFEWDGVSNILVFCQRNNGAWNSTIKWAATEIGTNVMSYKYQDSGAYDVTVTNTMSVAQSRSNTIFKGVTNGGGLTGPEIVANPDFINMGYRPIGYWMEPVTFELYNQGTAGTITSVNSEEPFFAYDVEVPFVIGAGESLFGKVGTSTTAEAGDIDDQLAVTYQGPGLSGQATAYVNVAATAYDAVSPDVWELAQEVTEFPFQETTTTDNLYKNYNLPGSGMTSEAKDAVYKVTVTEDAMINAGVNGGGIAAVYTEDFNGAGGPSNDNNYTYNGPEVGPGPISLWFNYNYTGSNTWFGTSTGGEMVFGYKIASTKLQELGLGSCAITMVEAAAREGSFYDLVIMKGGDTPDFNNMVYYQENSNYEPFYFFTVTLDEPQFLGDDENLWIMFYSDSQYAAYCGRSPVDTEGVLWYTTNVSDPSWSSNSNYTPEIYTRFLELPTGREVTVNLADFSIRESEGTTGELAEANGSVNGVSKAQLYNEMKAQQTRGNRNTVPVVFNMTDQYSDGWNGGYISVVTDNGGAYQVTLSEGGSGEETLDLEEGSHVTLTWNAGSFDSEVSFTVTMNDEVIYSVSQPSAGLLFEFDVLGGGGSMYQINNMFVPAGTYYVVLASAEENFQVNLDVTEAPAPEQATVFAPYELELGIDFPYLAEWALGNYTTEMQVLLGLDNPPTTPLIDWTSDLVESIFLPELLHNRMYYIQVNERNSTGTTEGEIIPFTTICDLVQNFRAATPYLYIGDVLELLWSPIEDEEFVGYNIFRSGQMLNEEPITDTTFMVEGLTYNTIGYYFNITAVYQNIASGFANTVIAYMTGDGVVEGSVYEQDGETPIANANVLFAGYNEYGFDKYYTFVTDEEGSYSGSLNAGNYYASVEIEGYQTKEYPLEIYVAYNDTVEGIDFVIDEMFYGVDTVTAVYNPDETDPNSPYVKVDWVDSHNNRSFNGYRVYRTAYDNDGPYSVYNTDFVAEVTDGTSYVDESWENLEVGLYKYGVGVVYEGNRDGAVYDLYADFDEGLPEGWTMIDGDGDGRNWMRGSDAALGFGHGHNGSNDMMISKSFENGGLVCPDNYLVTPQVNFTEFSEFSFWACAQDANYDGEYFEVMVSTTENEYAYNFVTVAGWSLSDMDINRGPRENRAQGTWYQFMVDLSEFAGNTGYIAIRHCYNCGNFYLDIDDVKLYNADAQLPRESEIMWSEPIGKDMFLYDGAVNVTVMLNSGDSPAGAVLTLENLTEPDYVVEPVTFDETGYYAWETFRKGEYIATIAMDNYNEVNYYVSIWEPVDLQFMIDEIMTAPANLQITSMGYATWDEEATRHFTGEYYIGVISAYGYYVWDAFTTDTYFQIPEYYLNDGMTYSVEVYKQYSSGWWSDPVTANFTYKSCDHFQQVTDLTAQMVEDGVYMKWEYPESAAPASAGTRDAWNLLNYFNATSGYQYGVATDGEYIYTSSWSASSSSMFYKYDANGNLIEEFDIAGCGQIRDLTYDGQYFYGVANSNTVYCLDFNNHTLVSSFTTSYGNMRCCSYDSERDGFWVVGNWSGNLTLINRYGDIVFTGPAPTSASGVAYYKDNNGVEHVLIQNNSNNCVYDYDIATNTILSEPVFDFITIPEITGTSGGCHVGNYGGKLAFFADIQQSPQFIGIFELGDAEVETHTIVGANIYYNYELVDYIEYDPEVESYTFVGENYEQWDTYSIELVFEDHLHSCVEDAYMLSIFDVTVNDWDIWALHFSTEGYQWYQYEGGSVIGTGEYLERETCTLIAVPDPGYAFYYWYDMNNGQTYETDTITFVVDAEHHNFEAFFFIIEQHLDLVEGWNWCSTFIEQDTLNNGFAQLTEALTANGDRINSQTAFTKNYGDYGWYGSLTSLNNESMYKIKMNAGDYISIQGQIADPAEHPITLNNGWNWISYLFDYPLSIDYAFEYLTAANGDMVKSQYGYAHYYEGYGWFGSLNTIEPGMGLMYKSVSTDTVAVTFTYGSSNRGDLRANLTAENNYWVPDMNAYPNNMTVMAVVELNDNELRSDNYELAAFVNGECRGSVRMIYAEPIDRYVAYLTLTGDEAAALSFGLYNAQTGATFFNDETGVMFATDATLGNANAPYVVSFRGEDNSLGNGFMVYPNPVANGERINIVLSSETERAEASIINTLGEVVSVETLTQSQTSVALPSVPGVYTIRIITENNDTYFRKVIVE